MLCWGNMDCQINSLSRAYLTFCGLVKEGRVGVHVGPKVPPVTLLPKVPLHDPEVVDTDCGLEGNAKGGGGLVGEVPRSITDHLMST